MVETSTLLTLLGFAGFFLFMKSHEVHQAHVDRVISELRHYRDRLEKNGDTERAERASDLAWDLAAGAGIVAQKVSISRDRAVEIERSVMDVMNSGWLAQVGFSEFSVEIQKARKSLHWLAKQVVKRA